MAGTELQPADGKGPEASDWPVVLFGGSGGGKRGRWPAGDRSPEAPHWPAVFLVVRWAGRGHPLGRVSFGVVRGGGGGKGAKRVQEQVERASV